MTAPVLHFVVPGPLEQLTGGYVYDGHMVAGLRSLGWEVEVHNLSGAFPEPDAEAREALTSTLGFLPDGSLVVIDGLAMGGLPEPVAMHADRLRIVSLVHHPLATETGLSPEEAARLAGSERRALSRCVGVLVTSGFTARTLDGYGVTEDRIRTVLPGTDPAPPAAGPPAGEPPRLLCVASLTPRKGHDVLVSALARVRDLDWSCAWVGSLDRDPTHAAAVLRAAAEADLTDRIELVGEHAGEPLEGLYHSASVFVLASWYEGYGMALAEALARGLPVVSTTGGAIPYTVPADAGLLVEPGDAEAFSGALRRVLDPDATTRVDLRAAALRHAATLPTWTDSAEAFARALVELAR